MSDHQAEQNQDGYVLSIRDDDEVVIFIRTVIRVFILYQSPTQVTTALA